MPRIQSVTVFCSSSRHVPRVYFDAAAELGTLLAQRGWRLVYGGNRIGLMGALADAVRNGGGKVTGITPQLMIDQGIGDDACDELIVTADMRQRKALMEQRGDAILVFPGGLGTLEEMFETLVGRLLGYHRKPIVLVNIDDYFGPLLAMIEHGIAHRFIKASAKQHFEVAADAPAAIALLTSHEGALQP